MQRVNANYPTTFYKGIPIDVSHFMRRYLLPMSSAYPAHLGGEAAAPPVAAAVDAGGGGVKRPYDGMGAHATCLLLGVWTQPC